MENRIPMDTNAANKLVNDTIDALSEAVSECKECGTIEQIVQVAEVVTKLQSIILNNGIAIANLKNEASKTMSKIARSY